MHHDGNTGKFSSSKWVPYTEWPQVRGENIPTGVIFHERIHVKYMVSFLGGMLKYSSTQHLPMVSYASFSTTFSHILLQNRLKKIKPPNLFFLFLLSSSSTKDDSGTLSDYSLPHAISHIPLLLASLHVLQVFIFAWSTKKSRIIDILPLAGE